MFTLTVAGLHTTFAPPVQIVATYKHFFETNFFILNLKPMPLRIVNGFDKLSDSGLLAKANNIMTGMTGNTSFSAPIPTLPTVQTAILGFSDALAIAQSGSSYDRAVKNQKKQELIDLLHTLGNYVQLTANGDAVVAQSSNFNINKPVSPAPPVTAAINQQLEDGENSGEVILSFDKVPGAKSYIYQCTPDPLSDSSQWESQTGTVRKVSFSALELAKRYWFRVVSIGINGQGVYSEPVSRIVQ